MPYPLLQKKIKKRKEQDAKQKSEALLMGNLVQRNKKKKDGITRDQLLKRMIGDRRGMTGIGDGSRAPRYSVGTYSKGTLYLSKNQIEAIKNPKRITDDQATIRSFDSPKPNTKGMKRKGKKK
eukprot:CAMPEP_0206199528 /NCGR_PEP_ID=MMETSP0166-20121206/10320_1 /ASSEMBLY_ACC=CAM_ASM_000260 /TAXON_ID=95228 /ORGANISM="Vannella robusta, Strain DIVA3 518/3/11/1/6" /LENGTH=122 /DNA_ID=CAMNT_0053617657 /DNA_START=377 /DNA_END=742 /DNA_ORIENTATION=-